MIAKPLLALAGPLMLTNAQAEPRPEFDTPPVIVEVPGVAQVMCAEGRGTAFRTGSHAYTSANHVTSLTDCTIDGDPIETTFASKPLDFSSNRVATGGDYHRINCEGFKSGRTYVAVGYARGTAPLQRATAVHLAGFMDAALFAWSDFTVLTGEGRFIPGQSGAPVFDAETYEVVGIVKGFSSGGMISYARDLSTTPLCTGHE